MNKIIKALLEAKYPTIDTESLLEIINNTDNPTVATEIICGLYEEPFVEGVPSEKFDKNNESKFDVKLIKYNKWNYTVDYSYRTKKSKTIWAKNGEELPSYDDIKSYETEYYFKDFAQKGMIKDLSESDYSRRTVYGELGTDLNKGYCSITDWNGIINK